MHRRPVRRQDHRPDRCLFSREIPKKAHIDIDPKLDQQIHPCGIADHWRCCECSGGYPESLEIPRCQDQYGDGLRKWWGQIDEWKKTECLRYNQSTKTIKPQYALERLEALTKDHDRYICTEVGQHQMWAAQFLGFEDPNRWMTSGGLGTMGYGFPSSIGVQVAHPDSLVINVAGEASWLMNMQELGTAAQYRLPVKQFILNNERLGMVRQWQELLHGGALFTKLVRSASGFRQAG